MAEERGGWEKIQAGVHETERLIGQKKYNMAMVRARQTLEYMVRSLCEQAGIEDGSLIDMIDALEQNGVIDKTTYEHYNRIRMIGNKAIHEDDSSAYNANQAYHLLSQEVYTFANGTTAKRAARRATSADSPRTSGRSSESGSAGARRERAYDPDRPERSERPERGERSGRAARDEMEDEEERPVRTARSSGRSGSGPRRKSAGRGAAIDPSAIIKPLLLIAIIVVLSVIIRLLKPVDKPAPQPESIEAVETEEIPEETEPEETEPEETEAQPVKYRVNTEGGVRIRSTPSTDDENNILVKLDNGAEVDYLRDQDDKWAVILYNGNEAYVAKQYISPAE